MSPQTTAIVSKVWSFCNVLRDAGVSYGDYLEQLTYLIFLKMAAEYAKPPYNRPIDIPRPTVGTACAAKKGPNWKSTTLTPCAPSARNPVCWAKSSPSPKTKSRTRPCSSKSSI